MSQKQKKLRIGILPGIAGLYNRAWAGMQDDLKAFMVELCSQLEQAGFDVSATEPVSSIETVEAGCRQLEAEGVDLIIVALAPYCPSGVLVPVLKKLKGPVLLWPVQSMYELEPKNYDQPTILLNHGVHAVQDLANALGKTDKPFGIIHGHLKQKDFVQELKNWAQAGRAIHAMQRSNPVQIGGHFVDMLDLQIGADDFIKRLGVFPRVISCEDFSQIAKQANNEQMERYVQDYRNLFEIDKEVDNELLVKTARGEYAVRQIMMQEKSSACGINFLELCNDPEITDALHVPGSRLMYEGLGYAGEGDWVTAMMVYGMQEAFGVASFSEMFSVGYADNRLVLRHWGEGNFAMAREKPKVVASAMNDAADAKWVIVDFEFEPGQTTLLNLNSSPDGQGQIITTTGEITKDNLPKAGGPRAVFKPDCEDVRKLLTDYAYKGGSHHLALVKNNSTLVAEKICRLTGWKHISL